MRITIAAVGRDRAGQARALYDTYVTRCPWSIQLIEVSPLTSLPPQRRLKEEAERLLKAVPPDAVVVALDEKGRSVDSRVFAEQIAAWRDDGRLEIAFLIGGADGLAPSALARAQQRLAFGQMTWPHRLVRVMLLEQLYRASTILSGHPYHRD